MSGRTPQTLHSTTTRDRAVTIVVTTLATVVTWIIAVPIAGVDLAVERWDNAATMTVGLAHVLVTTLLAALAGWASLAVLERVTAHARRVWAAAAIGVLVLSLGTPATLAVTTSSAVVLVVLHIVVGSTLIPMLARSAR